MGSLTSSWPADEPMVIHLGLSDLRSSGSAAWNSQTTPNTLGSMWRCRSATLSSETLGNVWATPALAMTRSRRSMPLEGSDPTASSASASAVESILTTTSLLLRPAGRSARVLDVGWLGSRTAATTVWSSLAR